MRNHYIHGFSFNSILFFFLSFVFIASFEIANVDFRNKQFLYDLKTKNVSNRLICTVVDVVTSHPSLDTDNFKIVLVIKILRLNIYELQSTTSEPKTQPEKNT